VGWLAFSALGSLLLMVIYFFAKEKAARKAAFSFAKNRAKPVAQKVSPLQTGISAKSI